MKTATSSTLLEGIKCCESFTNTRTQLLQHSKNDVVYHTADAIGDRGVAHPCTRVRQFRQGFNHMTRDHDHFQEHIQVFLILFASQIHFGLIVVLCRQAAKEKEDTLMNFSVCYA